MNRAVVALVASMTIAAPPLAMAADPARPLPAPAGAEAAGPDDGYGFLDGTGVGNAGDRGVTVESTARFGKLDGRYLGINSKLEAAWTPVNRIQVAVAVWSSYHAIRNNTVPGYPDQNRAGFDGLAGQVRYMLRERGTAPFDPGFTVGLELRWARFSEGLAVPAERFAATLKFALDAALVGDRLYGAINVNLGPGTEHPRGLPGHVSDSAIEVGGALAWRVSEGGSTFVGANLRYVAAYGGAFFNQWAGHAVFVGPTVFHRFGDAGPLKDTFVSLAWNAQVWGRAAGAATGNLDLVNHERHQLRVKIGGAF
ncbi:hypothetical protein [Phreatobacter sp.]|uniref:hypothetical protein n=1 Tax=Phreatobacter sp. TaxID=1966341 RepID=UPI003F730204